MRSSVESRRKRLEELKRKLQVEVLNKSETLVELEEINKKLSQVFATKDIKEILIDKGVSKVFEEIKVLLKEIEKKTEKPKEVKIPPYPKIPWPPKRVWADVDWKNMPRQMEIDWKRMPRTKMPKVQKVKVDNFPDEIADRVVIEKDDLKRPRRIVEEFDGFTLETTISRKDRSVEIETNRK